MENKVEESKKQLGLSLTIGFLLTFCGGFFDGYTYLVRDNTFATMQTGNMIMFIIKLFMGNMEAFMLLLPILAFSLGVIVIGLFNKIKQKKVVRIVFCIVVCLLLVVEALIKNHYFNFIGSMIISFVAGMQLELFQSFCGIKFMTTMCTGNLVNVNRQLIEIIVSPKKEVLKKMLIYIFVIIIFALGVLLSCLFVDKWNQYAILFLIVVYLIISVLIYLKREKEYEK